MKFPMVLVEAKPKAAPPMAEKDKTHSGLTPPTWLIEAMAPSRIKIRKVKIKLLVVLGSRLLPLGEAPQVPRNQSFQNNGYDYYSHHGQERGQLNPKNTLAIHGLSHPPSAVI